MKELNYWQQFLNTRRIEDYLKFRETATEEEDLRERSISQERAVMGENPYAGICEVNRDGFEDSAYRGIR